MQMSMNRKTATKLLLVQWARFQNEGGLHTAYGRKRSGKSTVLDVMTYLLTGNTQFNKAAKDRDRTVIGYVRGDTKQWHRAVFKDWRGHQLYCHETPVAA